MGKRHKKVRKKKCDHLDRQCLYGITKRLYYLLHHHSDTIEFTRIGKGILGLYYPETDEITIDYRRSIIPTLIHEALHKWHPEWSETKVLSTESHIVNALTPRQVRNIIKAIGRGV